MPLSAVQKFHFTTQMCYIWDRQTSSKAHSLLKSSKWEFNTPSRNLRS